MYCFKATSLVVLIVFAMLARAQCPDKNIVLKRIYFLRDSAKIPVDEQLNELVSYIGQLAKCTDKFDSVHALLYRRIGGLYFQQGEYLKSLQHYKQYILISESNRGKTSIDIKYLPGGYYWLSVIYDSLKMVNDKWKALDNCTDIAEKIGTIDRSNLYTI